MSRSARDLVVVVVCVVAVYTLGAILHFSDHVGDWTGPGASAVIRDFALTLFAFLLGLAWYANRRRGDLHREIAERIRAERAVRERDERYSLATAAARVGVWDWDIASGDFYLDPNVKSLLGYSDEEIPNDLETWSGYVHPDDRAGVMQAAEDCLAGRTPEYRYEHRMLHRDGSIRWVLVRGKVIRDPSGAALRMIGTDMDITERKEVEETLRESEERLRAVAEHVPGVVYSYDISPDRKRRLNFLGPGLEDLIGAGSAARVRTDFDLFWKLIHPGDLAPLAEAAARGAATDRIVDHALRLLKDDGDYTWVRTVSRPRRLPDGGTRWHIVLIDVTEHKRAERVLRMITEATSDVVGAEFFESLVRNLADTLEVKYVFVAEHIDEPVTRARTLAFWQDDGPAENVEFVVGACPCAAIDADERVFFADGLRGRFDCDSFPCTLNADSYCGIPLRDAGGRLLGHLAVLDDGPMDPRLPELPALSIVAARAAAELQRQRDEDQLRAKGELERLLLRELDHRVRNNLASLLSLVELTRCGAGDVDRFARSIRGRIDAMANAHALLSRVHWRSLRLQDLVEALTPPEARGTITLDDHDLRIPARQTPAMAMVLHELMTNSAKYGALGADGGEVRVAWEHEPETEPPPCRRWSWIETGGPPIRDAPEPGVGSGLLEGLTRSELRGSVELSYPRAGAVHQFTVTLDPPDDVDEAEAAEVLSSSPAGPGERAGYTPRP